VNVGTERPALQGHKEIRMSAKPKKLRLNIQTVRQLTNRESTVVVGGGPDTRWACSYECSYTCPTQTYEFLAPSPMRERPDF